MNHNNYSDINDWWHDAVGHYTNVMFTHHLAATLAISGIMDPLVEALENDGEEYFAEVLDPDRVRDIINGNWDGTLDALLARVGGESTPEFDDRIAWAA